MWEKELLLGVFRLLEMCINNFSGLFHGSCHKSPLESRLPGASIHNTYNFNSRVPRTHGIIPQFLTWDLFDKLKYSQTTFIQLNAENMREIFSYDICLQLRKVKEMRHRQIWDMEKLKYRIWEVQMEYKKHQMKILSVEYTWLFNVQYVWDYHSRIFLVLFNSEIKEYIFVRKFVR